MSESTTQPGANGALAAWFKSMTTGTAEQLEAAARGLPGVVSARALEDPKDKTRVVVLVQTHDDTPPQVVQLVLQAQAAAGAVVEVIRLP